MRAWPLLLAGLLSACSTPTTEPSEPNTPTTATVVAPPVVAVEPPFPPPSEILYEYQHFSTMLGRSPFVPGGVFPMITIYTDGTVLRANEIAGGPSWSRQIGQARLSPTQLGELRDRLAALAPHERVERAESYCDLEPDQGITSSDRFHFADAYRIRIGEPDWICYAGCPIAPAEFASEFLELLRLIETYAELDYEPWEPTHGHVAVRAWKKGPATLPWTNEILDDYGARAWVLDEARFASAWELVGRAVGPQQEVEVGGQKYEISVVPWRPGEDLTQVVEDYNSIGRWRGTSCPVDEEWPNSATSAKPEQAQ